MRHYDTINRIQDDGTLLGEEIAAYSKLDGQNICVKYSPKTKKFDQFGSRKRVFDETEYSDNLALECITNLRKGSNDATLRKYIASKSSKEVNAALKQIEACEMTVHEAPKHMSQFNIETNDYREYKPKYIRDIKYLIKNGYHRGYDDVYYEIKSKISYIPDTKTLVYIILSCIVLVPIIMLLMKYAFLAIFGLVCILALIKMIK